ncbi:FAD-binding oxidoreductase, partial [Candidatus Parcubacteria bacterium]
SHHEVMERIEDTKKSLEKFPATVRVAANRKESEKYWAIRRESFNLLRHKVRGKHTAPFVDDIIVRPEFLPEFLPKLYTILDRYQLLYTIAGHVGNGNFHIIPLMDLRQKSEREKIPRVSKEVYKLVLHYGGSLSAEHNDGLIRGPYLQQMYGRKVFAMFVQVKKIFDPQGIFNPRKKTGANLRYAMAHIRKDEP